MPRCGRQRLKLHNIELVRGYLEQNLAASQKECSRALNLSRSTVHEAFKVIRQERTSRSNPRLGADISGLWRPN